MTALTDLVHARRDRLTWLDGERYVRSVFAGACEHWHEDPGTMIGATAQAQKLLRSDVLGADLLGPFSRHLAPGSSAAMIRDVLEREEPRRNLADTLDALLHRFGDEVDVVLACPSPRQLLVEEQAIDFDELDDVSTALLEVVRAVADRPVQALLITCDTKGGPDSDELDSWSPVLAAAEHYHWVTAIRLNGVSDPEQLDPNLPGDLLLLPALEALVLDDRRHGAGLPPAVWTGSSEAARLVEAAAKRRFRFGEIPQDAAPEAVLDTVRALQ